jgi:hypothetical protein
MIDIKTKLNRAYNKRINGLAKNFLNDKLSGIKMFDEYLKYIRDCAILDYPEDATVAASLIASVAELEAFVDSDEPENKRFHWINFCEITKDNMEEWLQLNDSL